MSQTEVKKFSTGDEVRHIKFGKSVVVSRVKSTYSVIPDEYLFIRPTVNPSIYEPDINYSDVLMVEESSCIAI